MLGYILCVLLGLIVGAITMGCAKGGKNNEKDECRNTKGT